MIANQVKGTGFNGALKYLLGKEESIIIGGNMIGETPNELTKEFSASRTLRPNLKRAVYHVSLSLPHDENLSTSQWKEASDKYMQKMGFEGSQYVVIKHNDTRHQHVHILASRIRLDGSVVSDSQDYKRSEKVVRGLEKYFGLAPTISSNEIARKAPTKGELHKALREQKPSTKGFLQSVINEVTEDRPEASIFFERLQLRGIEPIPNMAKTGHISGISFIHEGEVMKGSDLGRGYTWSKLCKHRISYEQQNINLRSSHQSQLKATRRDDGWRTGRASGENKTRSYQGHRKSIQTDDQTNERSGSRVHSEGRSKVRRSIEQSLKYQKRNTNNSRNFISGKDGDGIEKVTNKLFYGEPNRRRNDESDREIHLEEQRAKRKQRRLNKKKQKSKKRSLGIDINF